MTPTKQMQRALKVPQAKMAVMRGMGGPLTPPMPMGMPLPRGQRGVKAFMKGPKKPRMKGS